jgi:hypothetical protein
MRFLHTIVTPNTDLAASASIVPFDLPVNPLSFMLLHLEVTNTNPAAIGTYSAIDDIITQITAIRVLHKGEQIIAGSLRDLISLNGIAFGAWPFSYRSINTNGAIRGAVFPLLLGRRPYDPLSCFPATTRGNLRFEMDAGADGAAYSDINFSLETVELIETEPKEYVKYVTSARTSVAGQFDAPLPIGNPLLGILGFDTGLAANTTAARSWGTIKLLKDNVEQYYPLSDVEVLAGMIGLQSKHNPHAWLGHIHQINDGAALSDSDDAEILASTGLMGYFYLDFDPLRDGSYQLETAGAADVKIRGNGDEATAVRYLPIERVTITKA